MTERVSETTSNKSVNEVQAGEESPTHTLEYHEEGNPASAMGFSAIGVHAGFRADPERLDMALVVADEPAAAAATFTTNVFCAAPVRVSKAHLHEGLSGGEGDTGSAHDAGSTGSAHDAGSTGNAGNAGSAGSVASEGNASNGGGEGLPAYGCARAVVVNSGIANAATGQRGLELAEATCELVGEAVGCPAQEVLVASTGVIGQHLRIEPFKVGVPSALATIAQDTTPEARAARGVTAARAIMTTDTRPKYGSVTFSGDDIGYPGATFAIGGMAKGAGMIMPNMATMIAVLTTDAPVAAPDLSLALRRAVNISFNKVTIDSDTSTNDCCFLLASGAAAPEALRMRPGAPAFKRFEAALSLLCTTLAREMAADGEGATRLITVNVLGAATPEDADAAARTVANSPLVKTAVYGHDANWGRVAAALGRSGARFNQEDVDIDILGLPVCRAGLVVDFDEEEALRRFEEPEVVIEANLHAGEASATMWTCDFSHDYVTINGDYRS